MFTWAQFLSCLFFPSFLFIAHSWQFVLRLERMTREWWVVGFVCCADMRYTLFQEQRLRKVTNCTISSISTGFTAWLYKLGYISLPTQAVGQCIGICMHMLSESRWTHHLFLGTSCINVQYTLILDSKSQWVKKHQRRSEGSACTYRIRVKVCNLGYISHRFPPLTGCIGEARCFLLWHQCKGCDLWSCKGSGRHSNTLP